MNTANPEPAVANMDYRYGAGPLGISAYPISHQQ